MKRFLVLIYGVAAYIVCLGVLLYLAAFIGNLGVPRSMDSTPVAPLALALLIDTLLIAVFGLQHSVMARPGFKRWWTKFVPDADRTEHVRDVHQRSTDSAIFLLAADRRDGVGNPESVRPGRPLDAVRAGMGRRARHDLPDQPF